MMRDKLLREAIADANMIQETAIANARAQLEEAFRPQLASALSAKLRTEIESLGEQNTLDSSEIGGAGVTVKDPAPKDPSKAAHDSSDIENKGIEVKDLDGPNSKPKAVNETDLPFDDDDNMGGVDMQVAPENDGAPAFGGGEMDGMGGGMDGDMDGDVDELDLEAIIQQLEADVMGGGDSLGASEPPLDAPMDDQPMEGYDDPMAGKHPQSAKFAHGIGETIETDSTFKNGEGKDGSAQKAVDGVNGGKEVKAGQEEAEHEMLEALDIEEILREVEAEEAESKKPWEESKKIAAENVELKARLREHRDVVVYLKDKLNELNILNSKLLYTNKLFRGFELDASKKMRVVETFDKAKTLREVKLVYMTLAESFLGKTGGKSAARKQTATSIKEGLASRPTRSTKSINEAATADAQAADEQFRSRMQKLAGITKIL